MTGSADLSEVLEMFHEDTSLCRFPCIKKSGHIFPVDVPALSI